MGIWVRSQDKTSLMNAQSINVAQAIDKKTKKESFVLVEEMQNKTILLGEYPTKERAIEVLDEIQRGICYTKRTELYMYTSQINISDKDMEQFVYQMPTE